MRRRDFIGLVGACPLAWPFPAAAQSSKVARVGIIDDSLVWDNFRKGLRELGYIEGQNITFEYRYSEGRFDRLGQAATELVQRGVDVIAAYGTPPTRAAMEASQTIAIVMISVGDPVGAGLVANLGRPGGNVTGNTILGPEMAAKRLQLLGELLPGVSRVAFLRNPMNASNSLQFDELQSAARNAGVTIIAVNVRTGEDFGSALASMLRQRPQALMTTNDPLQQSHITQIIEFLLRNKLPGMFQTRENAAAGGLLSYGASLPDLFRRAAVYVHKILQGMKPADLPIEQPAKFELVVNLKTAKAIGVTVSEVFLLRADEVIE
jgi:putative tryptophan/tyrosine transport system substrate-binding protein